MGGGYVGAVWVDLHLPTCTSLKEKRRQLRRLTQRLAQRHGCALAEVDHHDLWQRAGISAAVVGRDVADVRARLDHLTRALHADEEFMVVQERTTIASVEELLE